MTSSLNTLTGPQLHTELKKYMPSREGHRLGTCLVLDADRTLSVDDAGLLVGNAFGITKSIRVTFEQFGYQNDAFTAVSCLWSALPKDLYVSVLETVADGIQLRASWIEILSIVADQVPVLVLTAGIPQVWRRTLSNAGYTSLSVIGGCHRDLDAYVISAQSKADIVNTLQDWGWVVVAAGDSRVDLPMLVAANVALFVPDQKGSPSLRAEFPSMHSIRHLLVDDQRFDGMATCTPTQAAKMILQGGLWSAD